MVQIFTIIDTDQSKIAVDVQELLEAVPSGEGTIYVRHFRDYEAYEAFDLLLKGKAL